MNYHHENSNIAAADLRFESALHKGFQLQLRRTDSNPDAPGTWQCVGLEYPRQYGRVDQDQLTQYREAFEEAEAFLCDLELTQFSEAENTWRPLAMRAKAEQKVRAKEREANLAAHPEMGEQRAKKLMSQAVKVLREKGTEYELVFVMLNRAEPNSTTTRYARMRGLYTFEAPKLKFQRRRGYWGGRHAQLSRASVVAELAYAYEGSRIELVKVNEPEVILQTWTV